MSDDIAFRITGDSSGLTAEFEKLHRNVQKIVGDLAGTARGAKQYGEAHGAALKDSQVEMKRLHDAATRIRREFESPYARHKEEMKTLQVLYRMGKISADEFSAAAAKSKAAMENAGQAGSSAMEGIIGQIGTAAAGFVGVGSVIGAVTAAAQLLKNEYDDLKSRQDKAANKQLPLGAAVRQAVFSLGEDESLSPEQFEKELPEISKRTGVDPKDLAIESNDVFSARGNIPARQALTALEAAAKLAPDQPQNLPSLAASALDIQKATGQSPEQSLGQLLSVGTSSRVTSLKGITENIAPAMLGVSKFGDTPAEGGAVVAAISQGLVDPTGAQSKTTSIALAQQLEEFLPKLEDTTARIAAIQKSDDLRKLFLEGGERNGEKIKPATFERAAVPVIRGLLSGDENTPERKSLASAQQTIVQGPAAEKLFTDTIDRVNALPIIKNVRAQQTLQSATDRLQTSDLQGGLTSINRKGLDQLLEGANVSQLTRKLTGLKFDAATGLEGVNPLDATAAELEDEAARRREKARILKEEPNSAQAIFKYSVIPNFSGKPREAPEDLRVAAELEAVAQALRDLKGNDPQIAKQNELLERQNALVEEQNALIRANKPVPPPAPMPAKPNVAPPAKPAAAGREQKPAPFLP